MESPINTGLTWHALQEALRKCKTEEDAATLFTEEKTGKNRVRWLIRIQGRIRVLRTERENAELHPAEEA